MTEDTKNKIPCPICGELFDKRGLNGHIRKHKEPQKEGVNYEFDNVPQDEPEEDKLVCGACNTEIKQGVPTCPGCGGAFEW